MALPKVISQETYDLVVLENVQDFEKSLEEAIEDAGQEFEAQGVLLSNIIKNVSLNASKDAIEHPILVALGHIRAAAAEGADSPPTLAVLADPLQIFSRECELSLAHRVMASKEGAYDILISLISKTKQDIELLCPLLRAMALMTDGNPDILTPEGIQLIKELMDIYKSDTSSEAMEYLARWCLYCNLKHEKNRQALFEAMVPRSLVSSLANLSAADHKSRILPTFKAIRSFAVDDDIRAEFGQAHENCRYLVEEEGLIQVALDIIKGAVSENCAAVSGDALATLSGVCVRAEYCRQACEAGALDVINSILVNFLSSAILTKQSIALIATLAGDDNVKVKVMKSVTPFLITKALDKHQLHVGVCNSCCSAVSMLTLRHPSHAALVLECGAAAGILQAMKQHPNELQLQKMGCLAVRNICSRSPGNATLLCELQAADLAETALVVHGDKIKDMARGALRDLGVDLKLNEQWQGKGHELEQ